MLIAPQNPFHVLHFAETAYTAGDVPLALSYFLKVVEMSEDDSGVISRAWFGVKLVCMECPLAQQILTTSLPVYNTPIVIISQVVRV
jgi:hypothetical protein